MMNFRDFIPEHRRTEELASVQQLAHHAKVFEPYRTERLAKNGKIIPVLLAATILVGQTGEIYVIATIERMQGEFC